ncbi:putative metallothionein expression activator [Coleophoma cylindrospora]|uniref:Putative metallothionein expression activator n=1 Tax=Coleophoma cylindrospora TaxID=1849047 RepID=A0A3D8RBN8_9HELO|nr:putative metallothionein expression activator [Coleophoma cylindrospora]
MVSIADHTLNFLRQDDYVLYPDPPTMFSPQHFDYQTLQNFNIESHISSSQPRAFQDSFPASTAYNSATMYSEAPQEMFHLGSPEIGRVPSNLSTASAPSATSSAMGSPLSHGHGVPAPEWAPQGLGLNPGIVNYDQFGSTEYFGPPGMDPEFDLNFNAAAKSNSFVGECATVSTSKSRQHGSSVSSAADSFSSMSNVVTSPADQNPRSRPSPTTPPSSGRGSRDEIFRSPVSASAFSSMSPSSRRHSRALSNSVYASMSPIGRSPDMSSSPVKSEALPAYPVFHQSPFFSQSSGNFVPPLQSSYPSLIHGYGARSVATTTTSSNDMQTYQQQLYPESPATSQLSHISHNSPRPIKAGSQSPYMASQYQQYPYSARRPSLASHQSYTSESFSGDESKEKGRCTYPECGKVFKDLKAHMLTHQNERPEKCPIATCDYHIKGFARKYDKNRHTLTHYKGTMVCGFCPGSGSAIEKSFNRADVFKRHLTSVHGVEQTPPNSRKKLSPDVNSGKKLSGYAPDATGKCSTCSTTFSNAQDFYEHLDDCVLRIVQQEEPSEAINARRLAEVEQDPAVHDTLRANALPIMTSSVYSPNEDEDEEQDNDSDDDFSSKGFKLSRKAKGANPNGVQKSRGLTHSRGGVTLSNKGRKKRKDYPSSWGCPADQMKMKKRVMCVFDGQRRLWKDDLMLDTDYEVRMKLQGDERAYVTDLDVQTLRRTEGFHNATEEEKGPWISDDLTTADLEALMEVKRQ